MADSARQNILGRLRQGGAGMSAATPRVFIPDHGWDQEQRIERFIERMEAVRGEVIRVTESNWLECFRCLLVERGARRVLLAKGTDPGQQAAVDLPDGVEAVEYELPIEQWKAGLFEQVDAALTTTRGGIAETGTLILWPSPDEPRLMSLVPPLHVALLRAGQIHETFAQAMSAQDWTGQGMPTNALLISGPSKTADIEQVLAYGVHGPKQLVVLLIE